MEKERGIKISTKVSKEGDSVLQIVMCGYYTDGVDHSNLEVNSEHYPDHKDCVNCGSEQVTITDDKDICHECGFVYE